MARIIGDTPGGQPIVEYPAPGGVMPPGGYPGVPYQPLPESPGSAPPPPPAVDLPVLDWLGIPGLPPDIAKRIDEIFRSGSQTAVQEALAYLRSTPWYSQTYRGIAAGIAKGVIGAGSPEADYRNYVNQVNQSYRQFWGRDATADEIESFLGAGYAPVVIGQIGQGRAIAEAERPELSYLSGAFGDTGQLTEAERQAYGEEKAGRSSTLGIKIQTKVADALKRMQRVFEGTLATQPVSMQGGILAGPERQKRPDVGV